MDRIRVLVADSSPIYAFGLAQLLSEDGRIEVFNHVYSGRHVIDMMGQVRPEIVLIDSGLINHDGAKVLEMLQELHPEVKVIVLTNPENAKSILDKAVNAGAKGILPKNIKPKELIKSVIETAKFGASVHPTMLPQILEKLMTGHQEKPEVSVQLSVREREVIELVAAGRVNRDIAETLCISENTVKSHLRRISSKLKISSRIELARYVMLNRL